MVATKKLTGISKKTLANFTASVEAEQAAFCKAIDRLAEQARAAILPYFKKHGLDFRAGNGDWIISKPSADRAKYYRVEDHLYDSELPENILALLMLEITYDDHLGFYIRDINRGEW